MPAFYFDRLQLNGGVLRQQPQLRDRTEMTNNIDPHRSVAKFIHERHAQLVDEQIDASCPVYQQNARGQPEVIGSAVPLRIGGCSFLVTAAHVGAKAKQGLYVGGRDSVVGLSGPYYYTTGHNDGRAGDSYDLLLFPLAPEHLRALGDLTFIAADQLRLSERPRFTKGQQSKYLIVGYPHTKQPRQVSDGEMRAVPFYAFIHAAESADYAEYGADPSTHLILEFEREEFLDALGPRVAPDPHGMSGCAVSVIENFFGPAPPAARLVGIAIEYHKPPRSTIVATRVKVLLDVVRERYPDLRSLLSILM